MTGAAIIPESTNSSAKSDTPAMRLVPQSWIDRATQIESAADALVSSVNDAIQRAQEGSGRLYAANGVQMADRAAAVLEATFLAQEAFCTATWPNSQAEALRAEVLRWCDHVQRFEYLRHGTDPDASPHILAGHARKLATS